MPSPRICLYDIETAPSLGLYFDRYREGNIISEVREWHIMSFSYKWQGDRKIHYHCLPDYPSFEKDIHDDKALVSDLHRLIYSEADCLIAHNGDRFDQRRTKARFFKHGLPPPPPIKTIDTLKIAKRVFKLARWNPNPPILMTGDGCPSCHSHNIQRRGYNIARKSKTARMQCQECGQWFSGQREAA